MDKKIKEWKAKHGDVFKIEVENKKAYVRKPGRKDLSHASVEAMSGGAIDGLKYAETILKDCWLEGDDEIITDDAYFLAVVPKIEEISKRAEATVKKL